MPHKQEKYDSEETDEEEPEEPEAIQTPANSKQLSSSVVDEFQIAEYADNPGMNRRQTSTTLVCTNLIERRKLSLSETENGSTKRQQSAAKPGKTTSTPVEESSKKKRGRPRKYPVKGTAPKPALPPPAELPPMVHHTVDDCRLVVLKHDLIFGLGEDLPKPVLSPKWFEIREKWIDTVNNADNAQVLAQALIELESHLST